MKIAPKWILLISCLCFFSACASSTDELFLEGESYANWSNKEYETINLSVDDAIIKDGGIYEIVGNLDDGSLSIDTRNEAVYLILNNAKLHSSTAAPILIKSASQVVIYLEDYSENYITQDDLDVEIDENAAIFSTAPLTIAGNGKLTVDTKYNDGIKSEKSISILDARINIQAEGDGMVASLFLIDQAFVDIICNKDGLKTAKSDETGQGAILFDDGIMSVNANGKGFNAINDINILDGIVEITALEDGISAGNQFYFKQGTIVVNHSKEGIEAKTVLINDGVINIKSTEDGINAFDESGELRIMGGEVIIENIGEKGDGLDANNNLIIGKDAKVVVKHNIDATNEYPIDYHGTYTNEGGIVVDENENTINP